MARPLYVEAFEHFTNKHNDDKLKAFVAFGLYVEAEHKWASEQPNWPTEAKCKHYYDCLIPNSAHHYDEAAEKVIFGFVGDVLETQRDNFWSKQ